MRVCLSPRLRYHRWRLLPGYLFFFADRSQCHLLLDEFDDDFEEEAEDEYDVVEEFENDFVFVDPAEKKKEAGNAFF